MKIAILLPAMLLLAACPARQPADTGTAAPGATHEAAKGAARPPLEPSSSDDREERGSLASLANGATIVDRTGEAYFAVTPVNMIDGNPDTFWIGPPRDMPQSATIALPVRCRIESLGMRSSAPDDFHLTNARVEAAVDGGPFRNVAELNLKGPTFELFPVQPFEADSLRVTMLSGRVPDHEVRLESLVARGKELGEIKPPRIAGTWRVNGHETAFAQAGNHVTGAMNIGAPGTEPLRLEGGAAGNRMLRLSWMRGQDYGVAAVTVSPDGKHLSGLAWHEEPIPFFFDEGWLGDRSGEASPADHGEPFALAYLRRIGRWPLYGIAYQADSSIDVAASADALALVAKLLDGTHGPLRVVSHEFREPTAAANHARAQRSLDALHAELVKRGVNLGGVPFVAAGSEGPREIPVTDVMRQLYSSVDLEIRR